VTVELKILTVMTPPKVSLVVLPLAFALREFVLLLIQSQAPGVVPTLFTPQEMGVTVSVVRGTLTVMIPPKVWGCCTATKSVMISIVLRPVTSVETA